MNPQPRDYESPALTVELQAHVVIKYCILLILFTVMRNGLHPKLGKGCVDLPTLLRWLATRDHRGYVLVEQDILPSMGAPKQSARRKREHTRRIEADFS